MGAGYLFLSAIFSVVCLVAVISVGYRVTQWRWQRRASNRAFDRMVDEYHRRQDRLSRD